MQDMIRFSKPYISGNELKYIREVMDTGRLAGNGKFTAMCHAFFRDRYGFGNVLLTNSCTDALEMCALLLEIKAGDEVIVPDYTFVSTANAFTLFGARIVFADSRSDHPNLDEANLSRLITPKTKAVVVMHYGGVACDMDAVVKICDTHGIALVEDAAQAIDACYKGKPLGTIGHLAAFSFHETKNIIAGEGGMLAVNDARFVKRSEILWEKGTNRVSFYKGEVDKYTWVDKGSSYLPSELTAAFLFAQLENIDRIQQRRLMLWEFYRTLLQPLAGKGYFDLPRLFDYATNNAHLFYLICRSPLERDNLLKHLNNNGIKAVFHYLSLHESPYGRQYASGSFPNAGRFTRCLIRLPLYFELTEDDIRRIAGEIDEFYATPSA